jgi:hypothetical protein
MAFRKNKELVPVTFDVRKISRPIVPSSTASSHDISVCLSVWMSNREKGENSANPKKNQFNDHKVFKLGFRFSGACVDS